jgi:O-antigen/teichoic acid export membrane protein
MKKGRTKNIVLSIGAGFLYEIVSLVCGLVSQRLILSSFGSAYNGVTQSISQFISYIELMKAGIGGVAMAALFKPLSENDDKEMNEVLSSMQKFMKRIASIFVIFVIGVAIIYPTFIVKEFGWWFTASLVFIISISTFVQYYMGFTYQVLIEADQKGYMIIFMQIVTAILNTVVSIVLINSGSSIHIVKLGSSLVHVVPPLFFYWYVHKNYHIEKVDTTSDKIPQRWDAAAHEVAAFINSNTDVTVVTMFSGVREVSVYSIYYYVISNMKKIVTKFSGGFASAFGNMYAKGEKDLMKKNLGLFELIIYSLVSVLYPVALAMVVPFVMLYTKGVNDVNYSRPGFAIALTLASIFNCFRIPYRTIVIAIGHYKQTRNGAIMEAMINVLVSVICTIRFGLIGVAIGSLCAMATRSYEFANYLSKNVIDRSISYYFKHVGICLSILVIVNLVASTYNGAIDNWLMWVFYAGITTLLSLSLTAVTDLVFYKEDTMRLLDKVKSIILRKNEKV